MRQRSHIIFWLVYFCIETYVYYSQGIWDLDTMGKAIAYNSIAIWPRIAAAYFFMDYLVPRWRSRQQMLVRSLLELIFFLAAALLVYRMTINFVVWPLVHYRFPYFNPLDAQLSAYSFTKLISPIALLFCIDAICFPRKRQTGLAQKIIIEGKDFTFFKVNKRNVKVHFTDILYVESNKEYVRIALTNGQEIMTKIKISQLESLWAPHFVRIHRSYLVPLHKISAYTAVQVQLAEQAIPIGRTYQKTTLEKLQRLG